MCNAINHDDLNDSLDGFFADFGRETPAEFKPVASPLAVTAPAAPQVFEETCPSCRGSGKFRARFSGRIVGDCFKCKGAGKLTFKTPPAEREQAAQYRENAKKREQALLAEAITQFIAEHQAEWDWMLEAATRFEFAKEMAINVTKKGGLTERQLAAVRKCMMSDANRAERLAAEKVQREQAAQVVNIQPIVEAFAKATDKGVKRPIMRFEKFRMSLAPAHGANAGAIYVKARDGEDTYLGKIVDGKFLTRRECSAEMEKLIVETCANPAEAAIAYGRVSGECCLCGRELTNKDSIEAGIGPICAENYGF
jgi:hypothetical protein